MLETLTEPFRRLSRRFKHKRLNKAYTSKLRASLNSSHGKHLERDKRCSLEVTFEHIHEEQIIREVICDTQCFKLMDKVIISQVEGRGIVVEGLVVNEEPEVRIKLLKPLFFERSDLQGCKNKFIIKNSQNDKTRIVSNGIAIRRFEKVKCSSILHDLILGNYKDKRNVRYSRSRLAFAKGLPILKGNQLVAAKNSMMRRISLVEGVAGSGKTVVAAHIIHSLCRFRKAKVLFCSPTISSVDRMAQMIGQKEHLAVVKFSSKTPVTDVNSLDYLINQAIYNKTLRCLSRLHTKSVLNWDIKDKLHKKSLSTVKNCSNWIRNKMQKRILKKSNVVCCTIADIGGNVIRNLQFDVLVLDDTHLATEADCFAPLMTKGLKQVILLSEMRHHIRFARLSSTDCMLTMDSSGEEQFSSLRKKYGQNYKNSRRKHAQSNRLSQELGGLFERLLCMGLTTVALSKQFRMHDSLAAFPRAQFYLSTLKKDYIIDRELNDKLCQDLDSASGAFDWLPNKQYMTAIFPLENQSCSLQKLGTVLSKLIDSGMIAGDRIGIICNRRMEAIKNLGSEMGTVEDFVGREKDYIILYSVDFKKISISDYDSGIDFEKNDNALNIAITRARLGLFIVTNPDTGINYCKSWQEMLTYYHKHELIVGEVVTNHLINIEDSPGIDSNSLYR